MHLSHGMTDLQCCTGLGIDAWSAVSTPAGCMHGLPGVHGCSASLPVTRFAHLCQILHYHYLLMLALHAPADIVFNTVIAPCCHSLGVANMVFRAQLFCWVICMSCLPSPAALLQLGSPLRSLLTGSLLSFGRPRCHIPAWPAARW